MDGRLGTNQDNTDETPAQYEPLATPSGKQKKPSIFRNALPYTKKRLRSFFSRRKKSGSDTGELKNPAEIVRSKKPKPKLIVKASKVWQQAVQNVSYSMAMGAAAAGSILLFRMLNRTKVHGLKNIPVEHENVLYCINHCSLLDNFAFEAAAYVPKVIFKRKYLPISLADRKNFFGDPSSRRFKDRIMRLLGRHFFRHLKAYPVDRKVGDMGQVERWKELLKDNIVIVFPEGTRTRTGEIGPGKPGVGKLIYEAQPIIMPVYMRGTADVLGVGMKCPAVFRKIEVFIGKPMDMSQTLSCELPEDKVQRMLYYKNISNMVMDEIRQLNPYREVDESKAF